MKGLYKMDKSSQESKGGNGLTQCPLCNIHPRDVIYSDDLISVAHTKEKKGHKERIMVITNKHVEVVPRWLEEYAISVVEEIGKRIFSYAYKFVILSPLYGRVKDHWHYVCCAIDRDADDWDQYLGTPWIKVVEVKRWRK